MSRPIKIVLLGEGRVGKTSILLRYAKNEFSATQQPTTSSSFLEKRINLDGVAVTLSIWDTAGQEKYHALGPIFYRDADAAALVFDHNDANSFEKVQVWMKELRVMVDDDIPICIAGNKCDLPRKVDADLVTAYALEANAKVFWTSALLNQEIDDLFVFLAREVLARRGPLALDQASAPKLVLLPPPPTTTNNNESECC
jgi:Ras-related protein Rab-21